MGLAYAVGFIILIMRCSQIGPAGPTVTINNAAMIFGVLYGLLWLEPQLPNGWILTGAAGVLAALVMIGLGRPSNTPQSRMIGRGWLPMVMAGGTFSALSFMTQTYVGMRHPGIDNSLLYMLVGFDFSAVILFWDDPRILLRQRHARAGGVALGLAYSVSFPLFLLTYQELGPAIVLPVSVTTPMILIMALFLMPYRHEHRPLFRIGRRKDAQRYCVRINPQFNHFVWFQA